MNKKYCVIGKSLSHTLSPSIHKEFGIDYGVREISDIDKLKNFVENNSYSGYNVTIPYKKDIIPFLDEIDEKALEIGAVNTVVKINGKNKGYNTDIGGLEIALKKSDITLKDKVVMILGSGGASLTAQYLAKEHGAKKIYVISRAGDYNYNNFYSLTDTEVLINTTPVGMYPYNGSAPAEIEKFPLLESVFDLIYNPLTTLLIEKAKQLNLKCDNGLYMLVAQAKLAYDLFSDKKTSDEIIKKTARKIYLDNKNIILIGMPSAGKTTIGKLLAEVSGRKFVDTDAIVETKYGMAISEIFLKYGEDDFRNTESEALSEAVNVLGSVIAIGGGCVLKENNRQLLKRSGFICWIKRNTALLSNYGRPLSQGKGSIEKLYKEREPLYSLLCDFSVENNDNIDNAVKEIIQHYEKDSCY